MSDSVPRGGQPSFSLEAAHAADKEKEITYPPRPGGQAPDYDALRPRVLAATKRARESLGDAQT